MFIIPILIVGVLSKHTFSEDSKVKSLNNQEFNTLNVGRDNHSWFILFYRPSCPHCQKVMPIWEVFANHDQNHTRIAAVNCEDEKELSKLFGINAVPTIILISDGGNLHHYSGDRSVESFIEFMDKNWQNNETETPPQDDFSLFDPSTVIILLFLVLCGFIICIYFQERKEYQALGQEKQTQMIEFQDMGKQIEI